MMAASQGLCRQILVHEGPQRQVGPCPALMGCDLTLLYTNRWGLIPLPASPNRPKWCLYQWNVAQVTLCELLTGVGKTLLLPLGWSGTHDLASPCSGSSCRRRPAEGSQLSSALTLASRRSRQERETSLVSTNSGHLTAAWVILKPPAPWSLTHHGVETNFSKFLAHRNHGHNTIVIF